MTKGIKLSRKQNRALKSKLAISTMCAVMVISMGVNGNTAFAQTLSGSHETDACLGELEPEYTVNVSGIGDAKSYTVPDGENIASYLENDGIDIDNYILIDTDSDGYKIWDGYPAKDMTVCAYPCITIDDEKYVAIGSKADFEAFRDNVNNGCTDLNGSLTENIDISDAPGFGGIGYYDSDTPHPYIGKFIGNRHTIKLAMKNTEKSGKNSSCALFQYVGDGCELKGIDTTGTIYTKGQYASGLVGIAHSITNGNILIDSCSSSVAITYDLNTDAEAYCGGLIGCASANTDVGDWYYDDFASGSITVNNCIYNGEITMGESAHTLRQGGIFGHTTEGWLTVYVKSCYVDATFDKRGGEDKYHSLAGITDNSDTNISNFFYSAQCECGTSEYGEEYDAGEMSLSELAWRLNGGSFDEEYTNSEFWSYKDGSPVYADEINKPIYQVRFVDEGVYEGKAKLEPIYRYTTPTDQTVAAPVVPADFIERVGQTAKWMLNGAEYQEDINITADTKAVLVITDPNEYDITINGTPYPSVSYGTNLSSLIPDGTDYAFLAAESLTLCTKVDGVTADFIAISVKGTGEHKQMNIGDARDLMIFASLVNSGYYSGYTDLDGILTADIDISSISDFAIGKSKDCAYTGHFNGNWHTIKIGLVENGEAEATGLFRYLGKCAKIEKLTVAGTVESSAKCVGGIAGYYQPDSLELDRVLQIYNCTSKVSIKATGTSPYAGGILGYGPSSFDVVLCDYSGKITATTVKEAYCSGIVGYMDNTSYVNLKGCYVHMTAQTGGENKGQNFGHVRFGSDNGEYHVYSCYYDAAVNGVQGNYVETLSYSNIYDMNTYADEEAGYTPMSYFDDTSKSVKYSVGSYRKPLRITLTDPGAYENKHYEGYGYTDENGHLIFPDMTSFLSSGHIAHWYKDEVEVTGQTLFESECELVLLVELNHYTVSFDSTAGTGSMASITLTENDSYRFPSCTFTAPFGKKFSCWEYELEGVRHQAQVGDTCVITGDMTVSAVWVTTGNVSPVIPPEIIIVPDTDETPSAEEETNPATEEINPDAEDDKKDTPVIEGTVSSGKADAEGLVAAIEKAVAEGKTDDIAIKFDSQSETEPKNNNLSIYIDSEVFNTFLKSGSDKSMTVITDLAEIEFDADVIASICEQNVGDVRMNFILVNEDASKNENGDCRVRINISLIGEDGKEITYFGGASIKITVPIPKAFQDKNAVIVYSDGLDHYSPVEGVKNSNGTITFRTRHLSEYILMTQKEAEKLYNFINDFGTLKAHIEDRTDTTVTIDWDRYDDADGYIIYGNYCNHDGKTYSLKKLATIKDPAATEYTITGLESGAYYKFRVTAYKVVDGKKYVTAKSLYVRVSTVGGKQRFTSKIEIAQNGMKKANSVTINVGKSYSAGATRYNVKDKKVSHASIRYESSDAAVAKVSKKGKITAVGKGNCNILVIAENGYYEVITVKVK